MQVCVFVCAVQIDKLFTIGVIQPDIVADEKVDLVLEKVSILITLPPIGKWSIVMSVSVCLSVCVFVCVCVSAIISSELHCDLRQSFCACYLWPWLRSTLAAL